MTNNYIIKKVRKNKIVKYRLTVKTKKLYIAISGSLHYDNFKEFYYEVVGIDEDFVYYMDKGLEDNLYNFIIRMTYDVYNDDTYSYELDDEFYNRYLEHVKRYEQKQIRRNG